MVPLFRTTSQVARTVSEDEVKYLTIFNRIDIHTGFYYSHTYDLTRSLQENMARKIQKMSSKENGLPPNFADLYSKDIYTVAASNPTSKLETNQGDDLNLSHSEKLNERRPWDNQMMWNYFLIRDFYGLLKRHAWVVPVVHGSIDFKSFTDGGNKWTFILIARRSRHFAGTRYLRRGINQEGYVANWVEVEQIVWRHSGANTDTLPYMSSFVQVRGSIPFFWSQIPNPLTVQPDIVFDKNIDTNAVATRKHFARIFQKYSYPIYCLNLTKANNAREETVASEYRSFINYTINKELPEGLKIHFLHYDVKAKKKKVKNFPYDLFEHVRRFVKHTGLFSCVPCQKLRYSEDKPNRKAYRGLCHIDIQRGTIRTNCIDSLDRTNFA